MEQYRGRGIGTRLVSAGMSLARDQGNDRIYAATVAASGILQRLGWDLVREVMHDDEQSSIYSCELDKCGPTEAAADQAFT